MTLHDGIIEGLKVGPPTFEHITEAEHVAEAMRDGVGSRVLEARGTDADGGRVFHMQMIDAGTSKNGIRYPAKVLAKAAHLYEGVKSFDHHRTAQELSTSSLNGLCGHWRDVKPAANGGLVGDIHLLPSATHVAEALQASLEAQEAGLPPVVGCSHDVHAQTVPVVDGGRRLKEATEISHVLSNDIVADPSAGGRAIRLVAGGYEVTDEDINPQPPEKENSMTLKELLDLLRAAKSEDRAALVTEHAAVLEAAGFSADDVSTLLGDPAPAAVADPTPPAAAAPAAAPVLATVGAPAEAEHASESILGRALVREAVKDANLPATYEQLVRDQLPKRFTEAQVLATIATVQRTVEAVEVSGLTPKVPHVRITEADQDKKVKRLEATFAGNWQEGYTRISEAYFDVTGQPYQALTDDVAREIIRESWQAPTESGARIRESLTTTSWGEILGNVMNKRMVADYKASSWGVWRLFTNVVPLNDFRPQRLIRLGGYGTLPNVAEGAPYQPLTSPTDEEATYSPAKKGGTEDYTYEMAKNDDMRKLVAIPGKLSEAAAITLYREIVGPATGDATGYLTANPSIYDSVVLFHATHANTASGTTLGRSGLNTLRQKMRDQTAYGNSVNVLGLTPRYLLVPNELEDLAMQLCKSDRAVPDTTPGASDQYNLHQGLETVVLDSWTDANDYIVICDPADCPVFEIGFMDGKENPELFVNDDPQTGAVFTSDKITYKIRHIWGSGVVDYRGTQRMTN